MPATLTEIDLTHNGISQIENIEQLPNLEYELL
jgi:hypothetical protein